MQKASRHKQTNKQQTSKNTNIIINKQTSINKWQQINNIKCKTQASIDKRTGKEQAKTQAKL